MVRELSKGILLLDLGTPEGLRITLEARYGKAWRRALAKGLGLDPTYISHVVAGRMRQRKIEQLIAQAIGYKREDLWPDAA